ncbi:MAG: NAD(P)/FAD-dependent oxidoreductase [Bryobacteraceae bacterium]|nr:NAD(P)/FAD-dependent oxidoreductase [Bryobacteraceae bacterium]
MNNISDTHQKSDQDFIQNPNQRYAIIMGAGPAGLTAAFELLARTGVIPIVLEKSTYMGGISRTLNYKGNRMDIGGHRFFSKSDRVMNWWLDVLPIQKTSGQSQAITYQRSSRSVETSKEGPDPELEDAVMLVRKRKSRIYFLRRFFEYPITLSKDTLTKLGLMRTMRIGLSYMKSASFPIPNVKTLEQFFINRFGTELYHTFFKSYTEKVWGVPCNEISAEWGEQRIKGLSVAKTLKHIVGKAFSSKSDIAQKDVETSLIEQFLYPKLGPGQMWEEVARRITAAGGRILKGVEVTEINPSGNQIASIKAVNTETGEQQTFRGDYFFSTLPIKELVRSMQTRVPDEVVEISEGLVYRDFITVGLLVRKLKVTEQAAPGTYGHKLIADNWIYIQEPDVFAGRLQIFNNWSPYMVADQDTVWLGVEYFCFEGDELWNKPEAEMAALAAQELHRIGIIDEADLLDSVVFRMPKTYPAYFGTYSRFDTLREHLDTYENLFLVGRNGMHKYNNQDHSMLTAMIAVDNIAEGRVCKKNIWSVNTEMDYHEEKAGPSPQENKTLQTTQKSPSPEPVTAGARGNSAGD